MAEAETAELLRKHGGMTGEKLETEAKQTNPVAEAPQPKPPTVKAADISIRKAAGFSGNIESVKQAIADGADVNAKGGMTGGTPLHYAAMFGRKEIAELLIAKGADVNAKDEAGRTPLYEAAWQGRGEIAELLIAKGANVNAKNEDGKTPLDVAIKRKRTEIADLLRKHGGKTGEELKAEGK